MVVSDETGRTGKIPAEYIQKTNLIWALKTLRHCHLIKPHNKQKMFSISKCFLLKVGSAVKDNSRGFYLEGQSESLQLSVGFGSSVFWEFENVEYLRRTPSPSDIISSLLFKYVTCSHLLAWLPIIFAFRFRKSNKVTFWLYL